MTTTSKTEKNDDRAGNPDSHSQSPQHGSQEQGAAGSSVSTRSTSRPAALARSLGSLGPFSLMRRVFGDLERLTGVDVPNVQRGERAGLESTIFMPTIDVMRRNDRLVVSVDLPGMSIDDIQVTVDDRALVIEGERRSEHEQQDSDAWRCERSYGEFRRVIPLPEGADPTTTEARFENGVLEISLRAPEPARQQSRKIDIKTSEVPSEKAKPATTH